MGQLGDTRISCLPRTLGTNAALREEVLRCLDNDDKLRMAMSSAQNQPPPKHPDMSSLSFQDVEVRPPTPPPTHGPGATSTAGRKIDWDLLHAENGKLGKQGEKFVLLLEKKALEAAGHTALAHKVEWVSDTRGDGLGYDILSFDTGGGEKFIEVKTTNGDKHTRFHVTKKEVDVSVEKGNQYWLYRVFQMSQKPGLFRLQGNLESSLVLEPTALPRE